MRRRTPTMGTISCILRENSWGHGYATEAANQVVSVAFTTDGLNRLEAMYHPDTPVSGRVLIKAGSTRVGTSDQHTDDGAAIPTSGTPCTTRDCRTPATNPRPGGCKRPSATNVMQSGTSALPRSWWPTTWATTSRSGWRTSTPPSTPAPARSPPATSPASAAPAPRASTSPTPPSSGSRGSSGSASWTASAWPPHCSPRGTPNRQRRRPTKRWTTPPARTCLMTAAGPATRVRGHAALAPCCL
ncbi:GNAT family protein [Streptomyces lavendofoliae]|uniref:GNAT family N-acetyltransferase n=1 Tax=Streptomyces lavendofoliae TaxID=67314 RepID=UPI00300E78E3